MHLQKKNFKISHLFTLAAAFFLFAAGSASASGSIVPQTESAKNLVWEAKLKKNVGYLSDSLCAGREIGTAGSVEAAIWIERQFSKAALMKFDGTYVKHFYAPRARIGHNLVGFMPASGKKQCKKYIVIGAHYDHLGKADGKFFPGADANASGTVALCSLAEMFSIMKIIGKSYCCNLIFVAFDGKECNMAGSYAFFKAICDGDFTDPVNRHTIRPEDIELMVNIDQIGSSLSPVTKGKNNYILMLGNQSLARDKQNALEFCNKYYGTDLELCLSYYGSENFTRLFYRLSDQKVFVENKIPAVMFTSGITMNTNKPWDTAETLDYEILKRRIWLIYFWINHIM